MLYKMIFRPYTRRFLTSSVEEVADLVFTSGANRVEV